MSETRVLVRKDMGFWGNSLSLYIFQRDQNNPGMVGVAYPLSFNWVTEGCTMPNDASIGGMSVEAATQLMDSLWEAGIRPSVPMPGREAEIKHLQSHIEDLRKLLWNRVGMEEGQ